ncbi:MAG TPA: hypothetical protein VF510_26740 [Ktedonobacterales bacterium]
MHGFNRRPPALAISPATIPATSPASGNIADPPQYRNIPGTSSSGNILDKKPATIPATIPATPPARRPLRTSQKRENPHLRLVPRWEQQMPSPGTGDPITC